MAYPKLASLQTNYLNNVSTPRATITANTLLAYGATSGATSPSAFLSDDFRNKTTSRDHVIHLEECLEEYYKVAMDWDGSLFCGIYIDWNY